MIMDELAVDIMRRDAHELLDRVPEEKLIYLVQIMQGMKGLAESEEQNHEANTMANALTGGNREGSVIHGNQ